MSAPCIEVLMATYNGERFVAEQIDSIMNQSYSNLRLIIRDDGSKDQTRKIIADKVDQYPGKISWLPADSNLGVIGNFAALLEASQADYVMFSDQDDIWKSNKIEISLSKMQQLESQYGTALPLLVHTDLEVVDQQLQPISSSFWQYSQLDPLKTNTLFKLLGHNVVTGCTMMMNRALAKKSQPIPKETLMHDWWIALVAMAFGKIEIIPEATILYRQHGSNQLGAQKTSVATHLKQLTKDRKGYIRKAKGILSRQEQQARKFKENYMTQLTTPEAEMVKAYLSWVSGGFFQRVRLTLKYGSLKNGFAKNFGLYILRSILFKLKSE